MLIVFHLKPSNPQNFIDCRVIENARLYWAANKAVAHLGHYTAVAIVQGSDLEDAFELTSHIGPDDWMVDQRVRHLRPGVRERSTSTGDAVLNTETGIVWFCAHIGWQELARCRPKELAPV